MSGDLRDLFVPYFDRHEPEDDAEWCLKHLPLLIDVRRAFYAATPPAEGPAIAETCFTLGCYVNRTPDGYNGGLGATPPAEGLDVERLAKAVLDEATSARWGNLHSIRWAYETFAALVADRYNGTMPAEYAAPEQPE